MWKDFRDFHYCRIESIENQLDTICLRFWKSWWMFSELRRRQQMHTSPTCLKADLTVVGFLCGDLIYAYTQRHTELIDERRWCLPASFYWSGFIFDVIFFKWHRFGCSKKSWTDWILVTRSAGSAGPAFVFVAWHPRKRTNTTSYKKNRPERFQKAKRSVLQHWLRYSTARQ